MPALWAIIPKNKVHYRNDSGLYGGGEETRTPGIMRARQALYQLSYTPIIEL